MNTAIISESTLSALEKLERIIEEEEAREVNLDQVVERLLKFYQKVVPFN